MDKVLAAFNYIKARLAEPSTMAALAVVFALLGAHIDVPAIQSALSVGTLIFGTLGFFVKEAKPL